MCTISVSLSLQDPWLAQARDPSPTTSAAANGAAASRKRLAACMVVMAVGFGVDGGDGTYAERIPHGRTCLNTWILMDKIVPGRILGEVWNKTSTNLGLANCISAPCLLCGKIRPLWDHDSPSCGRRARASRSAPDPCTKSYIESIERWTAPSPPHSDKKFRVAQVSHVQKTVRRC